MFFNRMRTGSYCFEDIKWQQGYLAPVQYFSADDVKKEKVHPFTSVESFNSNVFPLSSPQGKGKITDCGYDQMYFLFTEIPAAFDVSFRARICVTHFPEREQQTLQEGVGIFLRDSMELEPKTGYPYANAVYAGACFGGWNGFWRSGISGSDIEHVKNSWLTEQVKPGQLVCKEADVEIIKKNDLVSISITDSSGNSLVDMKAESSGQQKSLWQSDSKKLYLGFFAAGACAAEVMTEQVSITLSKMDRKIESEHAIESNRKEQTSFLDTDHGDWLPYFCPVKTIDGELIYASFDGKADASGEEKNPLDLQTALNCCKEGQTILLKPGRYLLNQDVIISSGNSGTEAERKYLICSSADEYAILDFQGNAYGLELQGDYWDIKGIEVTAGFGFLIRGNHLNIKRCRATSNLESGFLIRHQDNEAPREEWPSHNLLEDCVSYGNIDISEHNADGFACKVTAGEGNVFRRCRAYLNSDDGFDLFSKNRATGAVKLEDCCSYLNGYKLVNDSLTPTKGNGNGFKLGGSGQAVAHVALDCEAIGNRGKGFTSNSNPLLHLERCTASNNAVNYNYYFTGPGAKTEKYMKECDERNEKNFSPEEWLKDQERILRW